MKYLFLSILMIGVGIGVVGCEDDDKDDPTAEDIIEFNGKISAVYSDDASDCEYRDGNPGCNSDIVLGYIIISDDRVMYNPEESLPEEYKSHGLNVWVRGEDLQKTSAWGGIINIVEIERL